MGKVGKGTRVRDGRGLWGDHGIGDNCVTGKAVDIGDPCNVEGLRFPRFTLICHYL